MCRCGYICRGVGCTPSCNMRIHVRTRMIWCRAHAVSELRWVVRCVVSEDGEDGVARDCGCGQMGKGRVAVLRCGALVGVDKYRGRVRIGVVIGVRHPMKSVFVL